MCINESKPGIVTLCDTDDTVDVKTLPVSHDIIDFLNMKASFYVRKILSYDTQEILFSEFKVQYRQRCFIAVYGLSVYCSLAKNVLHDFWNENNSVRSMFSLTFAPREHHIKICNKKIRVIVNYLFFPFP